MIRRVDDVSRGAWIAPRLGPFGGWVGSLVPRGFAAYARVLHRASDRRGAPVRWSEVAAATGAVLHPTAQWWKVARRPHAWAGQPAVGHDEPWPDGRWAEGSHPARRAEPREWTGSDPHQGRLDPDQLAALVAVLRAATEPDAVTAGFWEGESWTGVLLTAVRDDGSALPHDADGTGLSRRSPPRVPADLDLLDGPLLELPERRHTLLGGTFGDILALAGAAPTADGRWVRVGRTPSLMWPDDHAWCVATDVDLDSTLVAGSRALVDTVLEDPTLEALAVSEADSLMVDGDTIN